MESKVIGRKPKAATHQEKNESRVKGVATPKPVTNGIQSYRAKALSEHPSRKKKNAGS